MEMPEQDLTKCPNCGGVADNGHDRCIPPNPYYCSKCEVKEMEMPDKLDLYRVDIGFGKLMTFVAPNASEFEHGKYHHDRILKAKDARIAELETFIEKNGLELPI